MSLRLMLALSLLPSAALIAQAPPERMKAVPPIVSRGNPDAGVDIVAKNVVPVNFLNDKPVYVGQATKLECVVYEHHLEGTDPAPLAWTGRIWAEGKLLATFSSADANRSEQKFDGSATMTTWSIGYKADWVPAKAGYNDFRCVVDTGNAVSEIEEFNNARDTQGWVDQPRSAKLETQPPPRVTRPPSPD